MTGDKLQPLPVHGYHPQSQDVVDIVNKSKKAEEVVLRMIDDLKAAGIVDARWLAIGVTHIEQGFMAINRSIFKPGRISLQE